MATKVESTARTLVLWWVDAPTSADVQLASSTLASLRGPNGSLPYYISVVWAGSRPPDDSGREAFLALTDEVLERCAEFHVVLDCNPFIKAIARGLIAASGVSRRYPHKIVLHDALDQALMAVYEHTKEPRLLTIEMPELDGAPPGP
jgi:hypothetical protein